jgi:hypothetical protein
MDEVSPGFTALVGGIATEAIYVTSNVKRRVNGADRKVFSPTIELQKVPSQ